MKLKSFLNGLIRIVGVVIPPIIRIRKAKKNGIKTVDQLPEEIQTVINELDSKISR